MPFVSQSEDLCGGAAAAMVLRYWGARGLDAESFGHLVDPRARGIHTDALLRDLDRRGWTAAAMPGSVAKLAEEVDRRGRPVLALIEDRPGTFHYVVVVGMPERAVVFHDPARIPYRVMTRDEFDRRWSVSSRWMAVVLPRAGADTPGPVVTPVAAAAPAVLVAGAPATRCDALVADGVRLARSGDHAGAERVLTSALACPGVAAYRELAGLRAVQRRWPDAADLAAAAVALDASDADSWRVLATARFLMDDRAGALAAWNQVDAPTVDTVQITGLTRTRSSVIERATGIDSGEILGPGDVHRANRRLNDVPALRSATLDYRPVAGGRAEVKAVVTERRLFPSTMIDYATIGGRAIFTRDLRATIGAMTGSGERLDLQYRFRPGRPRVAAEFTVPGPWGGVWGAETAWERQPFDDPSLETSERTTGHAVWSDWLTGRLQVVARGGADRWQDIGARGMLGGTVRVVSLDDRVIAQSDVESWMGETSFAAARVFTTLRSSNERRGLVFVGSAGAGTAADDTPVDLWFAGDPGNAGHWPVLLRAHALVESVRTFRVAQMGRSIVHGSIEAQYWRPLKLPQGAADQAPAGQKSMLDGLAVGGAVFVDSARVTRRLQPGERSDVDVGIGLRIAVPGGRGAIRVDLAQGLVNGDTKFSFTLQP